MKQNRRRKIEAIFDAALVIFFLVGFLCIREVVKASSASGIMKSFSLLVVIVAYFFLALGRYNDVEKEK